MDTRHRIALTGGTGFVGQVLLPALLADGFQVRALARAQNNRKLPERDGLEWVSGDLTDRAALHRLTAEAGVVIHLAGATKANSAAAFNQINALQTAALIDAAREAGAKHFIHVSSLTATRPGVSAYAQSKAEGERLAEERAEAMALTIVRAPAILGPDDEATRPVLSMLAAGYLPAPGGKAGKFRFSVMDVEDLCRFLLELASNPAAGHRVLTPAGHLRVSWDDLAAIAARVTGQRVRKLTLPPALMLGAGYAADLAGRLSGKPQVFSSGKVRELLSGEWIAETAVASPVQLQQTLERCLAPFLASGRQSHADSCEAGGSEL